MYYQPVLKNASVADKEVVKILLGKHNSWPKFTIAIDASASIPPGLIKLMLGRIKAIMKNIPNFTLRVWCYDTKVYTETEFTASNINDITNLTIQGNGGTDADCIWKYLEKNGVRPDRLIVITDGYDSYKEEYSEYCPTLFMLHTDSKIPFNNIPFGETVHYKYGQSFWNKICNAVNRMRFTLRCFFE